MIGRTMRSAPISRWRALVDCAGLVAEVAAAIVIGLLITILVLVFNPLPETVATGPVPDQPAAMAHK